MQKWNSSDVESLETTASSPCDASRLLGSENGKAHVPPLSFWKTHSIWGIRANCVQNGIPTVWFHFSCSSPWDDWLHQGFNVASAFATLGGSIDPGHPGLTKVTWKSPPRIPRDSAYSRCLCKRHCCPS
jgi:hypothetical protein